MNIQKTFMVGAIFVLTACTNDKNSEINEVNAWDSYQSLAMKIETQSSSAPLKELTIDAIKLTNLSVHLLAEFVQKQPVCAEYIQAAMAAKDEMLKLTLEDIEAYYHADGKLPAMQEAVCYHAKDLLVHPATSAIISQTLPDSAETREQLKHEIVEVLEHFNQVKTDSGFTL